MSKYCLIVKNISISSYSYATFVIIKHENLSVFHQLLSTTLAGISFTMETTAENKLPFLYVLVHKLPSVTFET